MTSTDYTYIFANCGLSGGQRYSYLVERLEKEQVDTFSEEKWDFFKNYLAMVYTGRRRMSWSTVENCHRRLTSLEQTWGALNLGRVSALSIRQYVKYANIKKLCMSLRRNVDAFTSKSDSKSTLENYLKNEAFKMNLHEEREVVYITDLNKRNRQMLIICEIAKHYSVKNVDNIFLMHSPKWLKDITDSMYPGIIANNDMHYTDSVNVLETIKILWDGAQSAGTLSTIGQSAELL